MLKTVQIYCIILLAWQRGLGENGLSRLLPKSNFKAPNKAKSQGVRSPTCEVLGAAANLEAQSTFLGAPGYLAPVRRGVNRGKEIRRSVLSCLA